MSLDCPAGRDPSGLTWQAWSDQLVHLVLGALVWGGPQLKTAAAEEHESLMQKIQQYMDSRPVQVQQFGWNQLHDSILVSVISVLS